MTTELGPWDPMAVREVTDLLRDVDCPWWIAAGWATDLHLGRQTRTHDDTDVLILRDDQAAMQRALPGAREGLRPDQREWLARALTLTSPEHRWRTPL